VIKKILIIDDTILVRAMAEAILAPAGYKITCAINGADGRTKWSSWNPDLVFLDLSMPDESGWDVLEAMRATPQGASTPVYILSGEDDPAVAEDATNRGALGFIHKPFSNSELLEAVSSLTPQT
jgi:CheY-like chemotaxis protein